MESGDTRRAHQVLDETIRNGSDEKLRGLAQIFRIRIACEIDGRASLEELRQGVALLPPHVDLTMVQVLGYTRHLIQREGGCAGITRSQFADALVETVDNATNQPDTAWAKWMLRYRASALYASEERWSDALVQSKKAWQSTAPAPVAELLIDIYLQLGQLDEAERTFREARLRTDGSVETEAQGLRRLRARIDRARRGESRVDPFTWDAGAGS